MTKKFQIIVNVLFLCGQVDLVRKREKMGTQDEKDNLAEAGIPGWWSLDKPATVCVFTVFLNINGK